MPPATSTGLVLSLFPGVDLYGRAFEEEGFCIVRGPDLLWGGDINYFNPPEGCFEGIIGGSPCQDFSIARRDPPTGNGERMLMEFIRCVMLARPLWFCLENVPGVPDIAPDGYHVQRLNLTARDVGMAQNRNRCFQFGSLDDVGLVIVRGRANAAQSQPCATASEGSRVGRRSWPEFCETQGLPADFDLPGFRRGAKYRAVGNGVPLPMGRAVAIAIKTRYFTQGVPVCACNCGRPVTGKQKAAGPGCRKRLERQRRDAAGVTLPDPVTLEPSPCPDVVVTPQLRHAVDVSQP